MTTLQKILGALVLVLAIAFVYEWQQVKRSEAGPAKLVADIHQHATGGVLRSDLEPYLQRRGADLSYDKVTDKPQVSGVDHVIFRNIRHIGDSMEYLKGDFFYDQGDHLIYFSLHRGWDKPKH